MTFCILLLHKKNRTFTVHSFALLSLALGVFFINALRHNPTAHCKPSQDFMHIQDSDPRHHSWHAVLLEQI